MNYWNQFVDSWEYWVEMVSIFIELHQFLIYRVRVNMITFVFLLVHFFSVTFSKAKTYNYLWINEVWRMLLLSSKNYCHTSPTMLYLCHVCHGLVCLHLHSSFSFNYVIMLLRHCFLSRLWSAFCHFFIYLFSDFK